MAETVIEMLNNKAMKDQYLFDLLKKAQEIYGLNLFGMDHAKFDEKELSDILRFSDILSRSRVAKNRNIALKIVSILFDEYSENLMYQLFVKNVLVQLGNFPSLKILEKSSSGATNKELEIQETVKKIFQQTSIKNQYFTDSQYRTYKRIENSNHFSFSAGTSFGKSFLFSEYVKSIIDNGKENIAFLVPTRALISQVVKDLKKIIGTDNYKVVSNAEVPALFRGKKFIFVFTPERLVTYFEKIRNPNISTMIIDEAQNTVANDQRSPLFYHAITLAQQKSVKLFFASPNVPNPEIFLELVGNSTEENEQVQDLNVTQNKYFVDFIENKIEIYFDYVIKSSQEYSTKLVGFPDFLIKMTNDNQSLIYCNSIRETVENAQIIIKTLDIIQNKELKELEEYVRKNIHKNYYLADALKYGVAFHFGALPQEIREKIEEQFKKGNIKYLFTTSTLLQGVNLPAKNLFVLSDKIGKSKMDGLNFNNLIGRAGRLSKELYGNIFIIRLSEKSWGNTKSLLENKTIPKIESEILNGKGNFYKHIGDVISETEPTKSLTKWKKKQISDYATILTYQKRKNIPSQLIDNFIQKNKKSNDLVKIIESFKVPEEVLMLSTTINIKYQEQLVNEDTTEDVNLTFDYEGCLKILEKLFSKYHWEIEEDKNDLGNFNRLEYYAVLMTEWITSKPLNLIIVKTIRYMEKNKSSIVINNNYSDWQDFDSSNPVHINQIINNLMKDIENTIRYKVKNYILNYLKLTNQDDGEWLNYLEYGTDNKRIIELQKIGFNRQSAIEISAQDDNNFEENEENELVWVNKEGLLQIDISEETKEQIKIVL